MGSNTAFFQIELS